MQRELSTAALCHDQKRLTLCDVFEAWRACAAQAAPGHTNTNVLQAHSCEYSEIRLACVRHETP